MARSVTFGGSTQFHPGGLTEITTDGLTSIGATATGIVQLLGEATGGAPGLTVIDDPALARTTFRSGPLADAVKIAFSGSGDARIPGGAFRVLAYKTNASTRASVQLPSSVALVSDTASTGSSTTVITLVTAGLTIDEHVGRWLSIGGIKRRITANSASTITVTPGFPSAPVSTTALTVLGSSIIYTSADYGAHANQVSVEVEPGVGTGFVTTVAFENTVNRSAEIGGTSYLNMQYLGGPVSDSGTVTAASGVTVTITVAASTASNTHAGKFIRFSNGLQRLIASNTADTSSPFTPTFTLDAAHTLTTAEAAEILASPTAEIINVTAATMTIVGSSGVATGVTSTITATADNLSITFPAEQTLTQFVDYINSNTNYLATIPDGVNGDTTLMKTFDFGTRNTAVDIRFDSAISPTTKGSFRRDLQVLVDWVNEFSTLATAEKATAGTTEGAELPAYTGGSASVARDIPVFLNGGTRGISTNTSFQDGFDVLIQHRANHCVPLISEDLTNEGFSSTATIASVAQMLRGHVQLGRGVAKNELGGYLGFKGTKAEIIAQSAALNDQDICIFPQEMSFLNASNNLTLLPEWAMATAAASMRSGGKELGEPLTYKFIKTTQIENDASWSPTDRTDVNQLIQAGVMFAEETANGIRFVRDTTTHVQDDYLPFISGSMKDIVRYIAYDLRKSLEDKFTGVKAAPATLASMREHTGTKMQAYKDQNLITDSLDPETRSITVPGFRHLRVFADGNVAYIRVEIFPAPEITFQLNGISLQIPTLSA